MQPAATQIERLAGEQMRPGPSADPRARFEHDRLQAAAGQPPRRRDACGACADNGDVEIAGHSDMIARLVPCPQRWRLWQTVQSRGVPNPNKVLSWPLKAHAATRGGLRRPGAIAQGEEDGHGERQDEGADGTQGRLHRRPRPERRIDARRASALRRPRQRICRRRRQDVPAHARVPGADHERAGFHRRQGDRGHPVRAHHGRRGKGQVRAGLSVGGPGRRADRQGRQGPRGGQGRRAADEADTRPRHAARARRQARRVRHQDALGHQPCLEGRDRRYRKATVRNRRADRGARPRADPRAGSVDQGARQGGRRKNPARRAGQAASTPVQPGGR